MNEAVFPHLTPKDAESRALLLALWSSILAPYSDAEIEAATMRAFTAANYPVTPAVIIREINAARFERDLDANFPASGGTANALPAVRRLREGESR